MLLERECRPSNIISTGNMLNLTQHLVKIKNFLIFSAYVSLSAVTEQ